MIFIIVMIIEDLIKKILKEATTDSGSRGSYAPPLQPGIRDFDKSKLAPFTDSVSNYKSPLVAYDSYDYDWDLPQNQRQRLEKTARKISNFIKKHPGSTNSDEDGNVLNRTPSGKENSKKLEIVPIKEADTATSAGEYTGPIELGLKKWKKNNLAPFTEFIDTKFNHQKKQKTVKNNIKKTVGVWEKNSDGTYKQDEHDVHTLTEDLAVWFGKKKKPKGSSQPKGPWVDICRKVDGKHPPCGRSDASEGSYPKCRAAGVAGKMSDSEKRNACSQKRKAEKNDPQSGKGQKPVMVSHKKKTNENMKRRIITLTEDDLTRIVKRVLNEEKTEPTISPDQDITLTCQDFKFYMEGETKKIKLYSKYNIDGKLSTDSKVLEGGSFTDTGHLPGEAWGTGFVSETGSEYGLSFYVDENSTTSPVDSPYEPVNSKLQRFDLVPMSKEFKDILGISTLGDHMIFHMEGGRKQGYCVVSSNPPSEEFKNELVSNWGLNNDVF
jgi:hypothetical protein